ncbi:MAG: replication endonuclease [Sulfurovum sp.]|nr:replication endonuclease [Sulfurovum sp.]
MSKKEDFESITYGLTKEDLDYAKAKIKKQEKYLESNSFTTSHGEIKTLLDVSFSANLSERYYPRMLNKIDTFSTIALDQGLTPIFLTVTLDGFFRDLMKGDYSRFTGEKREQYIQHIPNNERNGFYLDYMDGKNTLAAKDLYKILGHQLNNFNMCPSLRAIRREALDYSYIRVTEPHKDGVPHFHILMYLPKEYIGDVYKDFKNFFPAPQNHKKLTLKYNKRESKEISQGIFETVGFQTEIRNASAYILKYILKSFRNLVEDKELDYIQAWYIKNKIPRIITTRTLVSQEIYTKIAPLDDDWYALTNIKTQDEYKADRDNKYYVLDDMNGRVITLDDGLVMISSGGKIVASYGTKKASIKIIRLRDLSFSTVKPKGFSILFQYQIHRTPLNYAYCIVTRFKDGTTFAFTNSKEFRLDFNQYQDKEMIIANMLLGVCEPIYPHETIAEPMIDYNTVPVKKMSDYSFICTLC